MGSRQIVKTIESLDGWGKVEIVRNSDGTFGFEEWRLIGEPYLGEIWIPAEQRMRTFADSPATAEREARARVDWLISQRDS